MCTSQYLDASALVKRYRTEKGTDVVSALFSGKTDLDVFVTSQFITVELESVAARGLKGKILNQSAYGAMLRSVAEDLSSMTVLPVTSNLISEAALSAREHALRAADALHFATALRVKGRASGQVVFVASDSDLVRAGRAGGFIVLDPEDERAQRSLSTIRRG